LYGPGETPYLDVCNKDCQDQLFQIVANSDGTYTFVSNTNKALDAGCDDSLPLKNNFVSGDPSQSFTIRKSTNNAANYDIVAQGGKCVVFNQQGFGGVFIQQACDGNGLPWNFIQAQSKFGVSGATIDSTNQKGISGGNLKIVFIAGDGTQIAADIDDKGKYSVQLYPGNYLRNCTRDGFADDSSKVTVGQSAATNKHIYLSPSLHGWRVILSWGAKPLDLDIHCLLPNMKDEINYSRRSNADATIKLDTDSRQGNGVETITLSTRSFTGKYRIYAENYSGNKKYRPSGDAQFVASEAKCQLYRDNDLVETVNVAKSPANDTNLFWDILVIDGDTQTYNVTNTLIHAPPNSN